MVIAAPKRELEKKNLRLLESELAVGWADISHVLKGFYKFADILIVLDEILFLNVSNLAKQLKLKPETDDDHCAVKDLTTNIWLRNIELTIVNSTNESARPVQERR